MSDAKTIPDALLEAIGREAYAAYRARHAAIVTQAWEELRPQDRTAWADIVSDGVLALMSARPDLARLICDPAQWAVVPVLPNWCYQPDPDSPAMCLTCETMEQRDAFIPPGWEAPREDMDFGDIDAPTGCADDALPGTAEQWRAAADEIAADRPEESSA